MSSAKNCLVIQNPKLDNALRKALLIFFFLSDRDTKHVNKTSNDNPQDHHHTYDCLPTHIFFTNRLYKNPFKIIPAKITAPH